VLLAALAASADERRFETALLRTLGANRRQLTQAVLGEFALLGACRFDRRVRRRPRGVWPAQRGVSCRLHPAAWRIGRSALAAAVLVAMAGWLGTRDRRDVAVARAQACLKSRASARASV
jgi:putative ABC transport system permease protein